MFSRIAFDRGSQPIKPPAPSCAPCTTAQRSRAKSYGVEFKTACAGLKEIKAQNSRSKSLTLDYLQDGGRSMVQEK